MAFGGEAEMSHELYEMGRKILTQLKLVLETHFERGLQP